MFRLKGAPSTPPQRFHFNFKGFEAAVQFPGVRAAAFRHAEHPSQFLCLFEGVSKLRKPLGAIGSARSIHRPPHALSIFRRIMRQRIAGGLIVGPLWSRNRLTFLHNARYQGMLGPALPRVMPMHALSTDAPTPTSYLDRPPVLIAGDSNRALDRAQRTVEAAGIRVADRVGLADAPARIARQAASSALWIELADDGGEAMDRLLDQANIDAGEGRFRAIVAAPSALLDPIIARLDIGAADLVIDGDESERTAALAVALTGAHRPDRVADIAGDRSAARLRQLSDEVSRIASTLARLSAGPAAIGRPAEPEPPADDIPPVTVETVRSVIRARRLRARYFPEDLFADPAWDMLLDLLQAEIAQLRVPVSSLCIAAAVPPTTALRWLKTMTQEGIFLRRADPHDGRRVFVELAPQASSALRRYFAEVGQPAVI